MRAIDRLFKLYTELDKYTKAFDKELLKNKKILKSQITTKKAIKLRSEFEIVRKLLKKNKEGHIIGRLKSAEVLLNEVEFLVRGEIKINDAIEFYREHYKNYFYNFYFCEKHFFRMYNNKEYKGGFLSKGKKLGISIKEIVKSHNEFYREIFAKYKVPYDDELLKVKFVFDKNELANTYHGIVTLSPEFKKPDSWGYYVLIHEFNHVVHEAMINKLCKKKDWRYREDLDYFSIIADGFSILFSEKYVNWVKDKRVKAILKKHHENYVSYCKFRAYNSWQFMSRKLKKMKGLRLIEKIKIVTTPGYKEVYYPGYVLFKKIDLKKLKKMFSLGYIPYFIVKKML